LEQNKNIITGRLRARGASTTHTPSRVVGPAHGGDAYEEAQAAAGAHSTALPRTIVVFTPVSSASRRCAAPAAGADRISSRAAPSRTGDGHATIATEASSSDFGMGGENRPMFSVVIAPHAQERGLLGAVAALVPGA